MDPTSGHAGAISPDVPLYPDGLVLIGHTLYIVNFFNQVNVLKPDKDLLTGEMLGTITDPSLKSSATGARFGNSLYVVNARFELPNPPEADYWVTKVDIHTIQP